MTSAAARRLSASPVVGESRPRWWGGHHSPGRVILIVGWFVPAIVATFGMIVVPSRLNPGLSLGGIIVSQMFTWLPWAGWSLLVMWVADRVPFARGRVARAIAVHILLCVVVVTGQILIVDRVNVAFGVIAPRHLDSILAIGLRSYGDPFTVIYWAILGAHSAIRWHEAWRAEAVRAARLSSDLAQAQLAALRAQLHPHFLFNALNAVVALVSEDPAAAKRVTVRLAELLRATLAATERSTLPLREELDLIRRYLDIETVRFGERLHVDWTVDEAILDHDVPAFVLQPLVENALVHAIAPRAAGGHVSISARCVGGALRLAVVDDGPGPGASRATRGNGVGLKNLRDRLERLYDGGATLSLGTPSPSSRGAEVAVMLPLDPRFAPPLPMHAVTPVRGAPTSEPFAAASALSRDG